MKTLKTTTLLLSLIATLNASAEIVECTFYRPGGEAVPVLTIPDGIDGTGQFAFSMTNFVPVALGRTNALTVSYSSEHEIFSVSENNPRFDIYVREDKRGEFRADLMSSAGTEANFGEFVCATRKL